MKGTITGCILARNEERQIEAAIRCLLGWTVQILVLDNESTDRTVPIARRYTNDIVTVPRALHFDALRNLAVEHAVGEFIYFADADERPPEALGQFLAQLVRERGDEFEALQIPFMNFFCGEWMQNRLWSPGYTRPQLLKKGFFHYNERLHSGVQVDGRLWNLPPDNLDFWVRHYSYDDLPHYLQKLNQYTSGEAASLLADGHSHAWQAMLAHFMHDFQVYYDHARAGEDGLHGFVLSFMSAFYRFASRAKLWDLRRQRGELSGKDPVPADLAEVLEFMAHVARNGPDPWLQPGLYRPPAPHTPPELGAGGRAGASGPGVGTGDTAASPRLPLLWIGPVLDPSGYADEVRNFILGLAEAGEPVAVTPMVWNDESAGLSPEVRGLIEERVAHVASPAELAVVQTTPALIRPLASARFNIARTMFETDGLPPGWAAILNAMDRLWLPSEFNRETFSRAGVDPSKIAVVPGALDAAAYAAQVEPWPVPGNEEFRFLTVFDWTLHKGWDVLLVAFAREFGRPTTDNQGRGANHGGRKSNVERRKSEHPTPRAQSRAPEPQDLTPATHHSPTHHSPSVGLILKVWSSNNYTVEDIRAQADSLLREKTGRGLDDYPNIHIWEERIPAADMPRLYRAVHAFVLPTRGEGWCRPLMEAMGAGLPTIATAWSGLTEFHHARVGYPLRFKIEPVSEAGARETEIYAGQSWAEPDLDHLRRLMRQVVENPEAARRKGRAAQKHVATHYSRAAVTRLIQAELARCRELLAARVGESTEEGSGREREGSDTSRQVTASLHPSVSLSLIPSVSPSLGRSVSPSPARTPITRCLGYPPPAHTPHTAHTPILAHAHTPHTPHTPLLPPANPVPRDPVAAVDFRTVLGRPLRVRWEGDFWIRSSLALVNRELCLGLLAGGDVELSLPEGDHLWHTLAAADRPRLQPLFALRGAPLAGPPDVIIRHHFPPDWGCPPTGRLIVMQPWEYGHLRRDWVEGAKQADEVWAYSRFVRDVYVRSGVPAEKVRVVPLGFNPEVFTPDGPLFDLASRLSAIRPPTPPHSRTQRVPATLPGTRLLYVGGTIHRKGADLLLPALRRAFSRQDDACLVVKDTGTETFYAGQNCAEEFRRAQVDPASPRVLYLDEDLSDQDLASLYRACTCVVLPYRGEGFGLSPLEGMACGLPAIVTAGGATDDYLEDLVGFRVPRYRRFSGSVKAGEMDCVGDPWYLEPDLDALAAALRWVRDHPEEARERGRSAREAVKDAWTWQQSAAQLRAALALLLAPPRITTPARLWSEPAAPNRKARRAAGARGERPLAKEIEISLCMIVRNEEPRIAACLNSVRPYVGEMIVVDTGSTDRTREIARECGARLFEMPWPDSFAEARNQSIALARGRWIIWLDADDVMPPACGQQLLDLVRRHPERDAAFHVQVRIPPGPGEFSEQVVDHLKLFPNRPELRFEHRIHEQILPSIRRAGLQVFFTDLYVVHQNYDRSPEGQATKRQRDFPLLELDLRDHPDHPFTLYNLGMSHLQAMKEYEVAAHYLQRSLALSHPNDSIVRKAFAMLTSSHLGLADLDAAIGANERGRGYHPDDAELLFQAGQVYQNLGRFEEARTALERLVSGSEEPHYRSVDVGLRTYRGRHELALLYRRMGDLEHCARVLDEIVARYPFYLPAQVDRARTLSGLGRIGEARAAAREIPDAEGICEELHRLRHELDMAGPCPSLPAEPGLHDSAPAAALLPAARRKGARRGRAPQLAVDWNRAPDFGRREPLLRTLQRLSVLRPGPTCIVEIGTLRNDSPTGREGDGWSTIAWGWYAAQTGGQVYTVDIEAEHLKVSRRLTAAYAASVRHVAADGIEFLRGFSSISPGTPDEPPQIHLLYLDSLDYDTHPPEESEEHHRLAAEAALPSLAPACLVLIDDTSPCDGAEQPGGAAGGVAAYTGKGARAVPFLLSRGFCVEWDIDGQVLLCRNGTPRRSATNAQYDGRCFRFRGRSYAYFSHPYNTTGSNERRVEVPLVLAALEGCSGRVLEIGNVLSHYGVRGHTVVDRYEVADGVLNIDIEAFDTGTKYDLVISISTLEHVGWDEAPRETGKVARVLRRIPEFLAPGGHLFMTAPMGYNPTLDEILRSGATGLDVGFLRRINDNNEWEQVAPEELGEPRYDSPFPYANVIAVLTR
jgi:glycosyltransferase involved in cell wall biosynthesis